MRWRELQVRLPVEAADVLAVIAAARGLTTPNLAASILTEIAQREYTKVMKSRGETADALLQLPEARGADLREPGPAHGPGAGGRDGAGPGGTH